MKTNKNGVTLIALIITIIVLLILAGVSISLLMGDNGLLTKATNAKVKTELAGDLEQIQLAVLGSYEDDGAINIDSLNNELKNIDGLKYNGEVISDTNKITNLPVSVTLNENVYDINGKGNVSKGLPTVTTPPTTAVSENTKYFDGEKIAVIPKGFRVSDNENEQTIETGLVVKDGNDNEWVWIPVDDVTEMYTTEGAPYLLDGDTGVTASMASKSEIIENIDRDYPTKIKRTAYYAEPDVCIKPTADSEFDDSRYGTAGFDSFAEMAQFLVHDYEDMIASIGNYKGFYIGRYELTGTLQNPKELPGQAINTTSWHSLYKSCKEFSTNEVESRMIWGCQWDMTCKFIANYGDKKDIKDSSSWGNYYGTVVLSSDGQNILKQSDSESSKPLETGITTFTKANNLYDIAGNWREWTQERYDSGGNSYLYHGRAFRGGGYGNMGKDGPAAYRNQSSPYPLYNKFTTRPTLYIK